MHTRTPQPVSDIDIRKPLSTQLLRALVNFAMLGQGEGLLRIHAVLPSNAYGG
jgi:hypothetical protein